MWLALAHSDEPVACHLTVPGEDDTTFTTDELPDGVRHCAGADIYRSNVCKRPRLLDHDMLPSDCDRVFAAPGQFTAHHS